MLKKNVRFSVDRKKTYFVRPPPFLQLPFLSFLVFRPCFACKRKRVLLSPALFCSFSFFRLFFRVTPARKRRTGRKNLLLVKGKQALAWEKIANCCFFRILIESRIGPLNCGKQDKWWISSRWGECLNLLPVGGIAEETEGSFLSFHQWKKEEKKNTGLEKSSVVPSIPPHAAHWQAKTRPNHPSCFGYTTTTTTTHTCPLGKQKPKRRATN